MHGAVMLTVAIDASPLHGHRTGVGVAVDGLLGALAVRDDVQLEPYVLSARARLSDGQHRLPLPATAAVRLWARPTPARLRPAYDRLLRRPDIVHGTNYVVPPTGVPRVVSVYDCWSLRDPNEALPDVRRAGAALRRAVDEGARVITSSRATAAAVRELLGTERVSAVHLGPPTIPAPAATARDRDPGDEALRAALDEVPFVLSLATGERRKNLPGLIDAFGRVAGEHDAAHLVLAGQRGDDESAIARALDRLPSTTLRRIHRPGVVDDDMRQWLLEQATVLAYPSLDEGFGFPILEAQQVGTPVVASSAGSIPEVAGAAALLSPPHDSEALAANLFWVLNDASMHDKLVRRGHANVGRFSWQQTAAETIEAYRAALEDGA